jgi:hypothetical protein
MALVLVPLYTISIAIALHISSTPPPPPPPSSQVIAKPAPNIDRSYYASVAVLHPVSRRPMGGATIIKWEPNQPILAISAYHVIRDLPSLPILGLVRSLKTPPYPVAWSMQMGVKFIRYSADLVLLESIKIPKDYGISVTLGPSAHIGNRIWVIGSPQGYQRSVTDGVISGLTGESLEKDTRVIEYRISAPIYIGNSGGGVFNENQELIGVIRAIGFRNHPLIPEMLVSIPGAAYAIHTSEIYHLLKGSGDL